ncbi:thioesterase II family protein [Burkholderia pseudomallei]|uniref:thioesterase II family protein n=1 Tax=Burkholderia pseudomallei TaxID=28450 RepID=UPI00014F958D|nr:thioesterase domain-containing protein [Burkholderia pseudomallei]APZ21505.1 peptide synthetase [Burkholderia pseudomallei]APZ27705.1 peptide synthetase [Burkholderia pseudomallei]EBA50505.1 putative thioesterase [Burkholderia pseudomallei 305]MBM5616704.1 thioesterase [Burkholderia pseudomallei]MBM5634656.1 thioesterase [Burkholderia pseudomallei]
MDGADMNACEARWFLFGADERKPDARIRLFCFHYAGSGGSIFRHWGEALPDDVELVAAQMPGRENRLNEPLLYSMDEAVPPLVDALAPLLDRPFAFFGHSTGALIGFEVARVLRARGYPQPRLLIASAQNAPDVKPEVIRHRLSDAEFVEVLRGCNGTPDAILQDPALLELLLPRIRADGAVFETYRYERQAPLDCRIVVFHGAADALVHDAGLARWAGETQHSFARYRFAGDHFFIHDEEASVLDHINRELEPLLSDASSTLIG